MWLVFLCACLVSSLVSVILPQSTKWLRLEFVAIPNEPGPLGNRNIIIFALPVQENLKEFAQKLTHRMVVKQKKMFSVY